MTTASEPVNAPDPFCAERHAGEPFAWEWVERIRGGSVSAAEVARHYLDRITSVNSVVNAIAAIAEGLVLAQAASADDAVRRGEGGLLAGLPITVKDNLEVQGLPCASGTWGRRNNMPSKTQLP